MHHFYLEDEQAKSVGTESLIFHIFPIVITHFVTIKRIKQANNPKEKINTLHIIKNKENLSNSINNKYMNALYTKQ